MSFGRLIEITMTPAIYLQDRVAFKAEVWMHSLPDDLSPPFTATEEKLIRLGLDPAAQPGEADACGVQLVRSFRKRGLTAEQLMASCARAIWAARELSAARGRVMSFGKYKNRTVGECPLSYLRWALTKCKDMPYNLRRARQLVINEGSK